MTLTEDIARLKSEIEQNILKNAEDVERYRIQFISKKGFIPALFERFKEVAPEDRKAVGKLLNELKQFAEQKWSAGLEEFNKESDKGKEGLFDYSAPGWTMPKGSRHPLSVVANEINSIFSRLGFSIAEGPEIEDDWHIFSALNFPEEHPAREV